MARLVAELDTAGLLVTGQRPRPRAFTYADISRLRFLDCVIRVRPSTAHKSFKRIAVDSHCPWQRCASCWHS